MFKSHKIGHCRWSDLGYVEVLAGPARWVRVRHDSEGHLTCSCPLYEAQRRCGHLALAASFLETVPCRAPQGRAFVAFTADDPHRIAARELLASATWAPCPTGHG